MNKWFVIRADSNTDIGIGHVMRCLSLAEAAIEYAIKPVLITKFKSDFLFDKLNQLGGIVVILEESRSEKVGGYHHSLWLKGNETEDADATSIAISNFMETFDYQKPDFILVDHYALGAPWEEIVSVWAPILVIDDLNDRGHFCKWLIDQTFKKNKSKYFPLVQQSTRLLIDTKYALLRKEFSERRSTLVRDWNEIVKFKLLISLGGIDKLNYSLKLAKDITTSDFSMGIEITIVTSSSNPNISVLNKYSENEKNVNIIVDCEYMADLMAEHHICIGAAGSTTWERAALSLPSLIVILADNQEEIAEVLNRSGVAINLGKIELVSHKEIEFYLNKLMMDSVYYNSFISESVKVCDGLGTNRVMSEIYDDLLGF